MCYTPPQLPGCTRINETYKFEPKELQNFHNTMDNMQLKVNVDTEVMHR